MKTTLHNHEPTQRTIMKTTLHNHETHLTYQTMSGKRDQFYSHPNHSLKTTFTSAIMKQLPYTPSDFIRFRAEMLTQGLGMKLAVMLALLSMLLLASGSIQAQDLGYNSSATYTNRSISGTTVSYNVRVEHKSGGAAGYSYLGYYVWPDPLGSLKYYLGQDYVKPLNSGDAVSDESFSTDAFGKGIPPGSYDVGFVVDHTDRISETNENNNTGIWFHGDELVIPASPNLTAGSGHVIQYLGNGNVTLTIKVKNNGNLASGGSYVKYYLSTNNVISASDTYIGQDFVASLAAGATGTETITFDPGSLGLSPGTYYVGYLIDANDQVNEWNELAEDNRYVYGSQVTVSENKPDLVPFLYSLTPNSVSPGQTVSTDARVENQGTAASTVNTKAGYYLSSNTSWDGGDVYLDENDVDPLAPGTGTPETETFNIPNGTAPGTYYILYVADHTALVDESNEGNNVVYKQITVNSLPDYICQNFSASSTNVEIGETINLSVKVKNIGSGNGGVHSRVGYFLSNDNSFNAGDYYLGSDDVNPLNAGQESSENENVNIPGDLGTGSKYLLAVADYLEEITESNGGNNTQAIAITVNNPPDPQPDLVVINAASSVPSAEAGAGLTLTSQVKNNGPGNAAASKIGYYLSTDNSYDGGDVKLADEAVGNLAANASENKSKAVVIPGGTTPGSYYLLFRADDEGIIAETQEGNNVTAIAFTVDAPSGGGMPALFAHTPTSSSGVFYGQAQIDGLPGEASDWIAAFDESGNCAGAAALQVSGGIGYISLAIYGNDPTTPAVDEGMDPGESFKLVLYDASADAYYEYPNVAAPTLFPGWSNTFGTPMPAYNDVNTIYNFLTAGGSATDIISLQAGWNLISLDVLPADNSVAAVFASLTPGNLQYVTGFNGVSLLYDPNGLPFLNTLTHIEQGAGYWVKVQVAENLVVNGIPIAPTYKKDLSAGWNLVGYLPAAPQGPATYFASLIATANLQYVTGFDGGNLLFDPNGPPFLNTLTVLENGRGYWVRVNSGVGGAAYRQAHQGFEATPYQLFLNGTSNIAVAGAEVEVRNERGELAAVMQVLPGGYLMTTPLYGDDPATAQKEGFATGERFYFVYNGQQIPAETDFSPSGELQKIHLEFPRAASLSVYPNPFSEQAHLAFELNEQAHISVEVYDLSGNLLDRIEGGQAYRGSQQLLWQPRQLPEGVYLLRLMKNGSPVATQRVVYTK